MEEVNTVNNIASENIDFSMFALFMSADLVVKSVILILIFASIYSWNVIVSKISPIGIFFILSRETMTMIKKGLVHLGSVLAIAGFPSSDVLSQEDTIEEIAVTGTRIRGANPDSFSPVSIINQEQIQISGKISIGEKDSEEDHQSPLEKPIIS